MNGVVDSLQTVTGRINIDVSAVVAETMPLVHIAHHVVDSVLDALVVPFQQPIFLDPNKVHFNQAPMEEQSARRNDEQDEPLDVVRRTGVAARLGVA